MSEALKRLLAENHIGHLLGIDVHELVLTHRFAWHLEDVLRATQVITDEMSVDIDYNRRGEDVKKIHLGAPPQNFRPDVIVHQRGVDDDNLLAIEWKRRKHNADDDSERGDMLSRLAALRVQYGYANAAYVVSSTDGCELTWIGDDGEPETPATVPYSP